MVETIMFNEEYPVMKDEWLKSELKDDVTVDDIVKEFVDEINRMWIKFFDVFDHYKWTTEKFPEGYIYPGIKAAKMIIFCGGQEIVSPYVFGVKPRNVWVVEMEDRFVISFLKIPNPKKIEMCTSFLTQTKEKFSK